MNQERQSIAPTVSRKKSNHADGIYIFLAGRALRGPFNLFGKWKHNLAYAIGYIEGMRAANPTLYDRTYLVEIQQGTERPMERNPNLPATRIREHL